MNVEYRKSSLPKDELHNFYRSSDLSEILSQGIYGGLGEVWLANNAYRILIKKQRKV
jgi:hypothetical protein